jgi:hypothetical protein
MIVYILQVLNRPCGSNMLNLWEIPAQQLNTGWWSSPPDLWVKARCIEHIVCQDCIHLASQAHWTCGCVSEARCYYRLNLGRSYRLNTWPERVTRAMNSIQVASQTDTACEWNSCVLKMKCVIITYILEHLQCGCRNRKPDIWPDLAGRTYLTCGGYQINEWNLGCRWYTPELWVEVMHVEHIVHDE